MATVANHLNNMDSSQNSQVIGPLPGEHARVTAARWVLRGYVALAVLGIILHAAYRQSVNQPINWLYQILTSGIGIAGIIGLWRLKYSLSRAMFYFILLGIVCVTGLLIFQLETEDYDIVVLFMFHIGIFTSGLILGFRPALYYATAISSLWFVLGLLYKLEPGEIVLPIALAFTLALPAKVVENLIDESTAELTRVNEMLRAENAERRRAEAELEKHRDHLSDMVEERTVELREEIVERMRAEEELRQRTRELETRNEELDAFAHTVAHDLKNPLTALVGFSELLESRYDKISTDKVRSTLNIIAQNGRKMTNIINELLLLATVHKAGDITMTTLDMEHIVAEAQKRNADLLKTHQAEVITIPELWPTAWGYGAWVEEIWTNYISNAIKYGGRPPRVELGATVLTDTNTIRFWVKDNGDGLTPDEQARLFKPFTRLDQVKAKGHGLGLSIVRRIVERLNGQVGVQSEYGKGSMFYFTLPTPNATHSTSTASQGQET